MQYVILATFPEESKAYQAYSDLKNDPQSDSCGLTQLALMKKQDGKLDAKEFFDSGADTTDDTWRGGLIGTLVGILGGPVGMLLGAGMGLLIGSAVDAGDALTNASLLEQAAGQIDEGGTALLALVEESDPAMLNAKLAPYSANILRLDAALVEEEAEEAARLQDEIAAKLRKDLRKERSNARKARLQELKAKAEDKLGIK